MEFLKKLNEDYRLFYIDDENHSITEIPLDDILDNDEESEEKVEPEYDESGEDDIDFSQFEPEPIPDEDETPYDLDSNNFDDLEHGEDGFQNPETKGEKRIDPNLTGMEPFDKGGDPDDPENYDNKEYHYPSPEDDHLNAKNTATVADDTTAYSLDDNDEDDQNASDFDDTEDYSDILGDMDLGSYLAKYAGQGAQSELGDEEGQPEDDLDQGEEDSTGLEDDGQGEEDPDFQGVIRTVSGACLVYKRLNPNDNTYSELWVFTSGDDNSIKSGSEIRRAILAGTDINPSTGQAEADSDETAETTTVGNVTFIKIDHLVN